MGLNDKLKSGIRGWLGIVEAPESRVIIRSPISEHNEMLLNRLWYRGIPSELQQFYEQIDDGVGNISFWRSTSSTGINFRKIHSGVPKIIIDTLCNIVLRDLNGINITDEKAGKVWRDISERNDFTSVMQKSLKDLLIYGEICYKLRYNIAESETPIITALNPTEFEKEYTHDKVTAIKFPLFKNDKYEIIEVYAESGIYYEATDKKGKAIDIKSIKGYDDLEPLETPAPLFVYVSIGKSILSGKHNQFDALDEIISQWIDALRDARNNKYIPEDLAPRHPQSGRLLPPNSFDNRYIATGMDLSEGNKNKIEVVSGDIKHAALEATYNTFLDLCLQGIISPSTIGVDVKKLDNAESQREKEKSTLYTRNRIIEVLEQAIIKLVKNSVTLTNYINGVDNEEFEVSVVFGEYANPSFEAIVETLGKAKTSGLMSNETLVNELYGDSWTDDEKAAEIERLNAIDGITRLDISDSTDDISII